MPDNNDHASEMESFASGPPGEARDPAPDAASEESQHGQAKAVSPQKLAANRANAQHSTGPRTVEGKERASQNSFQHGFFARRPLPTGAEGDKLWLVYSDLVGDIWEHYEPVGVMEQLLVEKVAAEAIRFSRILGYEGDGIRAPQVFVSNFVDRILRFQGAINRQLFQSIRELERLQEIRRANSSSPANGSDR